MFKRNWLTNTVYKPWGLRAMLILTSSDPAKFQVAQYTKSEREPECVKVKTESPTHLRLTATTTKSTFCALHHLAWLA